MENSSSQLLHRKQCMKCRVESDILMSSNLRVFGRCDHIFCQSCFRFENNNLASILNCIFKCPYCHSQFCDDILLIDEAILIGEAANMRNQIFSQHVLPSSIAISDENIISVNEINKLATEKLESALLLNPTNFYTLYLLFISCSNGYSFNLHHPNLSSSRVYYSLRTFNCALSLLDHPALSDTFIHIRGECCYEMAVVSQEYHNSAAAFKYSKQAYEYCLRSSDHTNLSEFKSLFIFYRAAFAKLPPLRFAVGDEVEFLYELETGSEWKLGKVVELYYRERDFDVSFSSPYRLQLLDDSDTAEQPPVYAWVKADIDRYVRKVGVRSIEDTRYHARLAAKAAELTQVFCSDDIIEGIYLTLAQDREFIDMLQSVWQIELSEAMLNLYRTLVMYRQPFVRTDSGCHVPSSEEVIAGIRAYFDPSHLSGDAAAAPTGTTVGLNSDSTRVRAYILSALCEHHAGHDLIDNFDVIGVQADMLRSIKHYFMIVYASEITALLPALHRRDDSYLTEQALSEMSKAISKASTTLHLKLIREKASSTYADFT